MICKAQTLTREGSAKNCAERMGEGDQGVPILLLLLLLILRMQPEGYGVVKYMFCVAGPYRIFVSPVSHPAVL